LVVRRDGRREGGRVGRGGMDVDAGWEGSRRVSARLLLGLLLGLLRIGWEGRYPILCVDRWTDEEDLGTGAEGREDWGIDECLEDAAAVVAVVEGKQRKGAGRTRVEDSFESLRVDERMKNEGEEQEKEVLVLPV
jgi:hypothetical protein